MKKPTSDLQRKAQVAYELLREGNLTEFTRRWGRNLGTLIDPVAEAYQLGQDAARYKYWQWQQRNGEYRFDMQKPFDLSPLIETPRQPKNVVWIMLDALRQDILETYLKRGGLATLTEDGAYFSRAFSQGSWTYPSVFSFLTGRYPFNCGVSQLTRKKDMMVSLCADFDDTCPTIFSVLRQHGYQTASILDGWGFTVRNTAGQEHREDQYFEENWGWKYGQGRRFLPLAEQSDATIEYIRQAAPQGPFMLFVRSLYTHSPYREIFKSAEHVTDLSRRGWSFGLVEGFVRGLRNFEEVYMDPLLATLKELGKLDDTIIVLCSDHGEMFWNVEEDLRAKGSSLDEEAWRHQLEPYHALVKVPLLIWGAGMQGVHKERFRLIDLLPTLLDEVGVAYKPDEFDGRSIHLNMRRPLYADSAGYGNGGITFQQDGAKLLMSHRLGATRYNIDEDGYEYLDLRQPADGDVDDLFDFVQQASRSPETFMAESEMADDVLLKRLQDLGYIE